MAMPKRKLDHQQHLFRVDTPSRQWASRTNSGAASSTSSSSRATAFGVVPQHATYADFGSGCIDTDFDEVRAKGRLLLGD